MIKDKFKYSKPDPDFKEYGSWDLKSNTKWHIMIAKNSFVPVEMREYDFKYHKSHKTLLDAMVYVLVSEAVDKVNRREASAQERMAK